MISCNYSLHGPWSEIKRLDTKQRVKEWCDDLKKVRYSSFSKFLVLILLALA